MGGRGYNGRQPKTCQKRGVQTGIRKENWVTMKCIIQNGPRFQQINPLINPKYRVYNKSYMHPKLGGATELREDLTFCN